MPVSVVLQWVGIGFTFKLCYEYNDYKMKGFHIIMESSKTKIKWYNQSFNEEWIKDLEFKDWLQQDKINKSASYCKCCCNFTLKNANRSLLIKHKNSAKHKTNFESAKSKTDISQFLNKEHSAESEQIAESELIIAGFFSEHNIPFAHAEHFVATICKRAFPDSQVAAKIAMKETKMSCVLQDGIAFYEKLALTDICKKHKFSIITDESTDISVNQTLAIVVRYFDADKQDVVDALLDKVSVENGTAQSL